MITRSSSLTPSVRTTTLLQAAEAVLVARQAPDGMPVDEWAQRLNVALVALARAVQHVRHGDRRVRHAAKNGDLEAVVAAYEP